MSVVVNVLRVAGTRPEPLKRVPVMKALSYYHSDFIFIHSGQHCNTNMFKIFMREPALFKTAENINAGSGS
jgi:UDP-N-acetylglucosamine 2-epimerase